MKTRIQHQHIRFRLSEEDIRHICADKRIESRLSTGLSSLSVQLKSDAHLDPALIIEDGLVSVTIPQDWTAQWVSDDVVGFEFRVGEKEHNVVTVVVEKDYPCAHTKEGKAIFGTPQFMPKRT